MSETTIEKFKANLGGELIQRGDEPYEEARKLYNGMIDKRPLLIARCVDVADIVTAVNFGRDLDLLIAIRGGWASLLGQKGAYYHKWLVHRRLRLECFSGRIEGTLLRVVHRSRPAILLQIDAGRDHGHWVFSSIYDRLRMALRAVSSIYDHRRMAYESRRPAAKKLAPIAAVIQTQDLQIQAA